MTKVLFSVHVGDSIAHVLRTREVARALLAKGYAVTYSASAKAVPFLVGYVDSKHIHVNDQEYSYAQIPNQPDIPDRFVQHVRSELNLFRLFAPDVIVGDTGIAACAYKPEVPLLRILNRFYIEVDGATADSPYSSEEKSMIRSQVEAVVNYARKQVGASDDFHYHEFAGAPALVNGASYFVNDVESGYTRIGVSMALRVPTNRTPDPENCLVLFGTGLARSRLSLATEVLKRIERHFKRIYVSYGTGMDRTEIYSPANAVMRPLFAQVPEDVGALICHGGSGAIHLGLELNVPIIAVPFQLEQFSNAHKMQSLGAGVNAGLYDKSSFRGLYETLDINWDLFEDAVADMGRIRGVGAFEDTLSSDTLMLEKIESFIADNA